MARLNIPIAKGRNKIIENNWVNIKGDQEGQTVSPVAPYLPMKSYAP